MRGPRVTTPTRHKGHAHPSAGPIIARRAALSSTSPRRHPRCQQQPCGASRAWHMIVTVTMSPKGALSCSQKGRARQPARETAGPRGDTRCGVAPARGPRRRPPPARRATLPGGGVITGLFLLLLARRSVCVGALAAGVAASEVALPVVFSGSCGCRARRPRGVAAASEAERESSPSLGRRQGAGSHGRRSAVGRETRGYRHDLQRSAGGGGRSAGRALEGCAAEGGGAAAGAPTDATEAPSSPRARFYCRG